MKKLALILLFLLATIGVFSQDLRGKVLEINEKNDTTPVVSASIQWLHTAVGTLSGTDGAFTLPRTRTDTLLISFPTYETDTLNISSSLNWP